MLTNKPLQMHVPNSNTERGITAETASLVDWVKTTVKSVYCEKWKSVYIVTDTLCKYFWIEFTLIRMFIHPIYPLPRLK